VTGKILIAALAATCLLPRSIVAQATFNTDSPAADRVRPSDGPAPMRVLWIAAHPDDEDTNLIAWLARGRNVNTAYMSLTRGDGGQNLIGNELGEELGVIRTEELLAARRIDGAHQFFGRGYDFGFSKTADETRKHWPQDSLLHDVITVMRAFRPQIIITTFSGTPRDGHGQHQISAIVARQAYDQAADTTRFPVKDFGPPWTPLKFYRLARFSPQDRTIAINVGEYDPNLGLA
jgi:LmbE family N-acetylglucosaminyl deacetylase